MDYTTLQAAILDQALRSDLATQCPGFIRLCEGMIRREVRALETRLTLVEADRWSAGVYNLPDSVQQVRSIQAANGANTYALENVGVSGIRMLPVDADPQHYAVSGATVEFRGVPGTDAEFEVIALGWPEPLATTSSNDLLTNHEALYLYGSLFHLYQFTQDNELAQFALSVYTDTRDKLNAQIARKIGGGSQLPAYNFGHARAGRGY